MVTIKDDCGCGCDLCGCDWKQKLKEAYARASISVNKVGDLDGRVYYPDGTGYVKLPLPNLSEIQQISDNTQGITDLKIADVQMQADIAAEETARKSKDDALDADIARIDATDTTQSEQIGDNAERITSTYNDLVATEATVAAHDAKIITLEANNVALAKSLVSDVLMTDGTTAGSVQVSIEREDGALIASANYRWGRDIGIRLEAGTQEGFVKAVISLSDGTELVSNEYKIVEVIESDVYVTAITLVPDMTAGTIGGNISYSNGTTQTINTVNVPTAPGVTSAIEALQSRMSAAEQKNTTQDSQITALDQRVQAIEDTPGVGQFGASKLGTIAGSASDGKVKAEDDGTGSVNGWSALKQRVTTAESQIVTVQGDVSDLDGLVASKVDIMQGTANAGKALVVGSDGNVAPGGISGGEVWEEVDLSNLPTDWVNGDRIRLTFKTDIQVESKPASWTSSISNSGVVILTNRPNCNIDLMITIYDDYTTPNIILNLDNKVGAITTLTVSKIGAVSDFNTPTPSHRPTPLLIGLVAYAWNGSGVIGRGTSITRDNISSFVYKMWRLKR